MITTAIIPVAGFGTRFLPATKAIPKTMFPIIDKPVLQYLIEEAAASGIKRVIIITGINGDIIKRHFSSSPLLEAKLLEKNKLDLLQTIKDISSTIEIEYVEQKEALGDGHAILCAYEMIKDEEAIAVLFGDDFITAEVPATKQLISTYESNKTPVVGVIEVPHADVYKYGIVATQSNSTDSPVTELIEKPKIEEAPSNKAIVGRYILTKDIITQLHNLEQGSQADGEIRIADALNKHLQNSTLFARTILGDRYDIGCKEGLVQATIAMAQRLG